MIKDYKNDKLKSYLEYQISQMEVDDGIKPVLVEIILRRAYQYDLTNEEIEQDVINLKSNFKLFSIGKMPHDFRDCAGLYIPNKKSILLQKEFLKNASEEELFEVFSHEVYHALHHDKDGNDILGSLNSITGQWNKSLLEAIVEKSAYRTVFNTEYTTNAYYNQNAYGYSDVVFILDAIEATYGVQEQALLRNATRGRNQLCLFLSSIANEDFNETMDFLDKLEANHALLFNSLYLNGSNNISYDQKCANMIDAISGMYNLCELKMQDIISNSKIEDIGQAHIFNENAKYNHRKLSILMEERIKHYDLSFPQKGIQNSIKERTKDSIEETIKIISDMYKVVKNADKFPSEQETVRIHNWARHGNLDNYGQEKLAELGILVDEIESIIPSEEMLQMNMEPEKYLAGWDNSGIPVYFKKYINDRLQNPVKKWFKNIFTKIFSKQKRIDSGIETKEYQTKRSSIFEENSPEKQREYDEGVRRAVEEFESNRKNRQERDDSKQR